MKHVNSISSRLQEVVNQLNDGEMLFPSNFLELGSPESINMAFSRLAKEKKLVRLGKGIYFKPEFDPLLGLLYPSLDEIAAKVAEKEKVVIRPTGAYALNRLGISTQVPTKVVFLTNGNARVIRIGKGTITFKGTTPKKLAVSDDLVFLAMQALIELGEDGGNSKVMDRLFAVLKKVDPAIIRENAKFAPHGVARKLYLIANKIDQDGGVLTDAR